MRVCVLGGRLVCSSQQQDGRGPQKGQQSHLSFSLYTTHACVCVRVCVRVCVCACVCVCVCVCVVLCWRLQIKKVGEYFIEVWKAAGMDMENVRFLWSSDEINKDPEGYWLRVINISRKFNISRSERHLTDSTYTAHRQHIDSTYTAHTQHIAHRHSVTTVWIRIKRCSQIMGRSEGDDQPASQIMYPCMQCADIFFLKADICQLGMDQRKVNMLAREYADVMKMRKHEKPIILSHALIPGLLEGQEKMSKSDPDSAIFMEDAEADVNRKIKKAFCPPEVVESNPVIAYAEEMILPRLGSMTIKRKDADEVTVSSVEELRKLYSSGDIHPGDLKPAVALHINKLIEPVRKHFETDEYAKKLLKEIKGYKTVASSPPKD
eukprot:GHVS01088045.1.p1 GENE.GHVS01088045.1~~GHVS01088045.1.p1  ORF type:complete len:378 (+),score=60.10 GHVS01088045.1:527-1660(+)